MMAELLSSRLVVFSALAFATLAIASVIRLLALRGRTDEYASGRRGSLLTWWAVAVVVVLTAASGRAFAAVVFAVLSIASQIEFSRLVLRPTPTTDDRAGLPATDRSLIATAGGLAAIHYACIAADWQPAFHLVIPVGAALVLSTTLVLTGQTTSFLSKFAGTYLGLILTAYFLSYAVVLVDFNTASDGSQAGLWFMFLVAVTELDDIAQALVGRRLGKRRLSPIVSPNKTWEGFAGGLTMSILSAIVLGPWLTSLTIAQCLAAGVLISVMGLLGDLNISACKRDAGVKDCGRCLPGHGGLLDRLDSLTFTAPAFYLFALACTR